MPKFYTSYLSAVILLARLTVPAFADDTVSDQQEWGPQIVPLEAAELYLGSIRLLSIHDEDMVMPNDGKTFGTDVSPADVATVLRAHGMPEDRIPVSINILYAEDGPRRYLFDTGMAPSAKGNLLDNLSAHQIAPLTITDIFITHSHPDHIGGLMDADGNSAFPKAKIHMSVKEWEYVIGDPKNADFVKKLGPQIVAFEGKAKVAPNVTAFPLPGHTPGHSGYRLTSKGKSIIDIADLAHSSVISLADPDWGMGFDGDKDTGKATRRTELAHLAHNHSLIFATHFPYPGIGTIVTDGKGYAWQSAN